MVGDLLVFHRETLKNQNKVAKESERESLRLDHQLKKVQRKNPGLKKKNINKKENNDKYKNKEVLDWHDIPLAKWLRKRTIKDKTKV